MLLPTKQEKFSMKNSNYRLGDDDLLNIKVPDLITRDLERFH
jgi:hypothetical protein